MSALIFRSRPSGDMTSACVSDSGPAFLSWVRGEACLGQAPSSRTFPGVGELSRCYQSLLEEGTERQGLEEAGPVHEEAGIEVPLLSRLPQACCLSQMNRLSDRWHSNGPPEDVSVPSDHLKLVGMTPGVCPSLDDQETRLRCGLSLVRLSLCCSYPKHPSAE